MGVGTGLSLGLGVAVGVGVGVKQPGSSQCGGGVGGSGLVGGVGGLGGSGLIGGTGGVGGVWRIIFWVFTTDPKTFFDNTANAKNRKDKTITIFVRLFIIFLSSSKQEGW